MAQTLQPFKQKIKVFKKTVMMFLKKIVLMLIFTMSLPVFIAAQSMSITDRTPEQEATKQTEKLQKELNLSSDQAKSIYEINLRYARERQLSNRRSDAMERIRNKDVEIKKVLNPRQISELENKRMEVQSIEIGNDIRYLRTNPRTRIDNSRRMPASYYSNPDVMRSRSERSSAQSADGQRRSVSESRTSSIDSRSSNVRSSSSTSNASPRSTSSDNSSSNRNSGSSPTRSTSGGRR